MNDQSSAYTPLQFKQAYHAMVTAYADDLTFTVAGFCQRFGYRDNRHTRNVLNQMSRAGLLLKQKRLFSDGHYRMQYSKPPRRLPRFDKPYEALKLRIAQPHLEKRNDATGVTR